MSIKRRLTSDEKRRFITLRRNFSNPVIGVTGNIGKTTTLDMLNHMLSTRGDILRNRSGYGNWDNNISLLEKMDPGYAGALFEFDYQRGNHFAEILRLIKPSVGIVTNFGDAHLSYLGDMIKIVLEKSAVVKYLARGGTAVLNKDDELSFALSDYISTGNIIRFGLSDTADFYASDIEQLGPKGMRFLLNGKYKVQLAIYSIQDIYSFLAAVAGVTQLGFSIKECIDIMENDFILAEGHGKLHALKDCWVLDESYSANPQSLSKAARSLIGFKPYCKKLVLIAGDMEGAGVNVEDQHLNMGYFLSALPIDTLITVGEYAKNIAQGAGMIKTERKTIRSCTSISDILELLKNTDLNDTVICLKGLGPVAAHRIIKSVKNRMKQVA